MQHAIEWRLQGKQKCGLRYVKTTIFCTCGSNNWETVADRWARAARGSASTKLSFHPCNILRDNRRGVSRGNKNVGCRTWKWRFFALAVRITGKLLQILRYMLRGVWQVLNCLSIHATYCVIIAGTFPGETKMWAAVRENSDFWTYASHRITRKLLKIGKYMLRGVWQTLNCLFVHATFSVIATGASPGQTNNEEWGT